MSKSQDKERIDVEVSSRKRAPNWTDTLDLIMLGLMRQANDEGHSQNGIFSKDTWRKMTLAFNQQTSKDFSYTNLKNRLKVLKKTFNLYYNLANRSGWGWDPVLKLPTPGDHQMWDEVIAANKSYARIKGKQFPGYEDLEILFSRSTASGRRGDTSALPEGVSDNETSDDDTQRFESEHVHHKQLSQIHAGVSASSYVHAIDSDHSDSAGTHNSPPACTSTLPTDTVSKGHPSTSSGKRRRSSTPTAMASQSRMTSDVSAALTELAEQGRTRIEIANEILRRDKIARPTLHTIEECMNKLETLPGVTPECIVAGLELFQNETYRWFFMKYEGKVLEAWLRKHMSDVYHRPYCIPPFTPSGFCDPTSYMSQPMQSIHTGGPHIPVRPLFSQLNQGTPNIFNATYMHSPTQGPTHSFTEQVFRASSHDTPADVTRRSPPESSHTFMQTSSTPTTESADISRPGWP